MDAVLLIVGFMIGVTITVVIKTLEIKNMRKEELEKRLYQRKG